MQGCTNHIPGQTSPRLNFKGKWSYLVEEGREGKGSRPHTTFGDPCKFSVLIQEFNERPETQTDRNSQKEMLGERVTLVLKPVFNQDVVKVTTEIAWRMVRPREKQHIY